MFSLKTSSKLSQNYLVSVLKGFKTVFEMYQICDLIIVYNQWYTFYNYTNVFVYVITAFILLICYIEFEFDINMVDC